MEIVRMRIGFVGLGQMGLVMAPHLLCDSWQVTGHDLVTPGDLPDGLGFRGVIHWLALA